MQFNNKPKQERIFIVIVCMFLLSLFLLCLTSCSGSCLGCNYACELNDYLKLAGCSHASEGCCSSASCDFLIGSYDFKYIPSDEERNITDAAIISCSNYYRVVSIKLFLTVVVHVLFGFVGSCDTDNYRGGRPHDVSYRFAYYKRVV